MEAELLAAGRDLDATCGPAGSRSFAYPCCQSDVGPEKTSYRPLAARLFPACRGGPDRLLVNPMECDFAFVPGWVVKNDTPLRSILSFVDEAIDRGQWAVLVFHNVGVASPLSVPRATHQSVVDYAARRRQDLWVETFLGVAMRIREATKRPWTG
jgi:hypothetical protein